MLLYVWVLMIHRKLHSVFLVAFLTIFLGLMISPSENSYFDDQASTSLYSIDADTIKNSILRLTNQSNTFQHPQQLPQWHLASYVDNFTGTYRANDKLEDTLIEDIYLHNTSSSSYRTSGWKESNVQYKLLDGHSYSL